MAAQVTATRQVFDHHIGALVAGDIDGIMADYSEESVVIGPHGVTQGLEAIRELFQSYLATLLKPGTYELSADTVHVHSDIVYVMWHANCTGADITFAADTFLMKDGKIALQTFAPKVEPHA
ncbi:MAG TPA: nuclear transport factor 2 family protein [Candidatus Dormibacteraeota bacterium]|nr:nuclear transport factor 2 family protein [Candidatus Dormibacteraeota bacterium]